MSEHSVAVCVCTRRRPIMLSACLDSLITQVIPEGWAVAVIVIENDDSPRCNDVVVQTRKTAPFSVEYAIESEIGIPFARNRAITAASALGVGWVAFIDDDEVAEPNWLVQLCARAVQNGIDVVQGPVRYEYPALTPDWLTRRSLPRRKSGQILQTAATNNVMFRRALAEDTGLGLKFDPRFRFTGGSDSDFFSRANDRGARIVWEQSAVVSEIVPETRLSLGWQLKRAFRVAMNVCDSDLERRGLTRVLMRQTPKITFRLLKGVVLLPLAVFWPLGQPFRRAAFIGMKSCASAFGGISGFTSMRLEPYRLIDGE